MDKALFDAGMALRKKVVGAEYVERSMASAADLTQAFQELVTEYCWGAGWTRARSCTVSIGATAANDCIADNTPTGRTAPIREISFGCI